ncbi:hypothetical protein [Candidatus Hodarchaeum mangrovi]
MFRVKFTKKHIYSYISLLFFIILTSSQIFLINGFIPIFGAQDKEEIIEDSIIPNTLVSKITSSTYFIGNYTFDLESLYNYVKSLYDDKEAIFSEASNGYYTSIATFEALSILRFFGLDYYLFGPDWQKKEDAISNKLLVDLKDKDSNGYLLYDPESSDINVLSLEGTYGVFASLWVMNELFLLKQRSINLVDFIINTVFNKSDNSFHEIGRKSSIKATFHALTILDLVYKCVTLPELRDTVTTPVVTQNVTDFMDNHSLNIFTFLDNHWSNNSIFESSDQRKLIENNWYALQSISILERFAKIIMSPLPKTLIDYKASIVNWIKGLVVSEGTTMGGITVSPSKISTLSETALSYAILNLLNATNELNHSETLKFVYSSQFLRRENRTFTATEESDIGGFSSNNITHSKTYVNKRVNIHDTYYGALTLLLTGDLYSSIDLDLKTSHYEDNININQSNFIIQGNIAEIKEGFTVYNYKPHGSFVVNSFIDNWNLTHSSYLETNSAFIGKSNAIYVVKLENDTLANYNWMLGPHQMINQLTIRNLPVIRPPTFNFTSEIFVGYSTVTRFNNSMIKPGDNVTVSIFLQNRSVLSYSVENITQGTISANLTTPTNNTTSFFINKAINETSKSIDFIWNLTKDSVLGSWKISIFYNNGSFKQFISIFVEVDDEIFLYNISKLPIYYPGNELNLNVSLKYSSGAFTARANASLIFSSNITSNKKFMVKLSYLGGNEYSTNENFCPLQFLYGYYNVSVEFTWNQSSGYKFEIIENDSLPLIRIEGIPTITNASLKTEYRNITQIDNITIYIGETINYSLRIGFSTPGGVNEIKNSSLISINAGIINNSLPAQFIQNYKVVYSNETIHISAQVNPNLPIATFGSRFRIKSEWNNSFVFIRDPINTSNPLNYNFTLDGKLVITEVDYVASDYEEGLSTFALDTTSVLSISFRIGNEKLNNISVPNLNLFGILDYLEHPGKFNQSLPSITTALDQNESAIYFLAFPTTSLSPNKYEITIYTHTALKANTLVGKLYPGFKIIKTFNPQPPIQPYELIIIILGISFIGLAYVNVKKFR